MINCVCFVSLDSIVLFNQKDITVNQRVLFQETRTFNGRESDLQVPEDLVGLQELVLSMGTFHPAPDPIQAVACPTKTLGWGPSVEVDDRIRRF